MSQKEDMRWHFKANANQPIPVYKLAEFGLQYQRIMHDLKHDKDNPMVIEKCADVMVNGQRQTAYAYFPDGQLRMV